MLHQLKTRSNSLPLETISLFVHHHAILTIKINNSTAFFLLHLQKPVQNKVTKKPKPVSVIEISSDTEKQPNKRIQVKPEAVIEISPDSNEVTNKKILCKEGLSRKKPQSLTSILTARSKVSYLKGYNFLKCFAISFWGFCGF